MKKLRRFAIVLAALLLMTGGFAGYVGHRVHQVPSWYHLPAMDAETKRLAAAYVDNQLIERFSAARHAQEIQRLNESSASQLPPVDVPPIQMTDDEINAWAGKWESKLLLANRTGNSLVDPIIVLPDNRIVLAATYKDWNVVVSLHFEPRLEGGKLHIHLANVMAGTLPLPRWAWSSYLDKAISKLEQNVTENRTERDASDIDARGRANASAVSTAMSLMMLHMLRDEPSEPVIFLPESTGRAARSMPMQITGINISNKTLMVQIAPMSADQREAFWQQILGDQNTIGMGKAPGK